MLKIFSEELFKLMTHSEACTFFKGLFSHYQDDILKHKEVSDSTHELQLIIFLPPRDRILDSVFRFDRCETKYLFQTLNVARQKERS